MIQNDGNCRNCGAPYVGDCKYCGTTTPPSQQPTWYFNPRYVQPNGDDLNFATYLQASRSSP